ncbi:MAG TPA: DUF1549 domain-containing protein [Thermoanaerobaculia bacterium]|jgi:hypothetical protein
MRIFLLGAPLLLVAAGAKETCPFGPIESAASRQASVYRAASANAELVAPSATTPSKRHSVGRSTANLVDKWIFAKMTADGVVPTTASSDEEFLRRVYLDLTGVSPDSTTVTSFLSDKTADKRSRKIDELLASDAFVDRWTMWFGDLVQNVIASTNVRLYYQGRNAYYSWIKDSIRSNKPYDQTVRELISGKGDSWAAGQADYVVRQLQPNGPPQDTYDNLASHSGEKFLGMPLLCLSCHNGFLHLEQVNTYLQTKKRSDFWGMAAFFSRTQARLIRNADPNNPNARKYDVQDNTIGSYRLNTTDGNKSPRTPATGQSDTVPPAYLFTGEAPRTGEAYRDAYARILTADRQFARATVNYLWKEMFGVGIVEPTNAFDLNRLTGSNAQPTHPELLEDLTTSFISSGYNIRALLKTMATSNAYQLSAKYTPGAWSEAWVPYFARRYPRRLMSEALLDSVVKATGVGISINVQGLGIVTKAMALPDTVEASRRPEGLLLNDFGRGNRDEVMRTNDGSIAQALSMMNNTIVTSRVKQVTQGSTVGKILASTTDPGSVADQIYLATLSRSPSATERQQAIDFLRGGTLSQRAEDLQWTLINSLEFLFY